MKIKLLKPCTQSPCVGTAGAVFVVDDDTADRLVRDGIAERLSMGPPSPATVEALLKDKLRREE